MESTATKVVKEYEFEKSGETIRVQIELENVSPQKREAAIELAKTLWESLLEDLRIGR